MIDVPAETEGRPSWLRAAWALVGRFANSRSGLLLVGGVLYASAFFASAIHALNGVSAECECEPCTLRELSTGLVEGSCQTESHPILYVLAWPLTTHAVSEWMQPVIIESHTQVGDAVEVHRQYHENPFVLPAWLALAPVWAIGFALVWRWAERAVRDHTLVAPFVTPHH